MADFSAAPVKRMRPGMVRELTHNTISITWKELKAYYTQPMAYVVAAVFIAITGFFFVDSLSGPLPLANLYGYLREIRWVLLVLVIGSVLTMRTIAEEQKLGTLELLLTSPVRDWEIVLGKYIATLLFFYSLLFLTLFYPLLLMIFASPDLGPMWTGYIGIALAGSAFLAIGILASSLTNNQIVAAVLTLGLLFGLWFLYLAEGFIGGLPGNAFAYISPRSHYDALVRGILDTGSVVYFITVTIAALFVATRSLESRRWR